MWLRSTPLALLVALLALAGGAGEVWASASAATVGVVGEVPTADPSVPSAEADAEEEAVRAVPMRAVRSHASAPRSVATDEQAGQTRVPPTPPPKR